MYIYKCTEIHTHAYSQDESTFKPLVICHRFINESSLSPTECGRHRETSAVDQRGNFAVTVVSGRARSHPRQEQSHLPRTSVHHRVAARSREPRGWGQAEFCLRRLLRTVPSPLGAFSLDLCPAVPERWNVCDHEVFLGGFYSTKLINYKLFYFDLLEEALYLI